MVYQIPGIIELVYGFFMNDNVLDQTLFFVLRLVCKHFQAYSKRLFPFLCPTINSEGCIDFWSALAPNLKSIDCIISLQKLSFSNLRKIRFFTTARFELNVCKWQCPLLEFLDVFDVLTSQSELIAIAKQFLHLTYLSICIKAETCFFIPNFARLEKLQITKKNASMSELYFVNLPCLQELDINNGFKAFHFCDVPKLTTIKSINGFFMQQIIFHDPMPLLVNLDFGRGLLFSLDPYRNIKWENVQKLDFIYSDFCTQHLTKLTSVTHLGIAYPPVDFLHVISYLQETLQKLDILWDENFTLDFKLLRDFRNLEQLDVYTDSREYIHFEDVFRLPRLQIFNCKINLRRYDKNLYEKWIKKQKRIVCPS